MIFNLRIISKCLLVLITLGTCIRGVHDKFYLANAPNYLFRFYIEKVMITTLNKLSIYR